MNLVIGNISHFYWTDRLHCGKEWVDMEGLGWYDNTARFHDAILCRFTTPDPLAEQYPHLSPYSHCANNPLTYVDPDGRVLRDADNNMVYKRGGKMDVYFPTGNFLPDNTPEVTLKRVDYGYIYTNNGTPVLVYDTSELNDARWITNCHGVTFADEKYWLPPESVQPLLDDEYTQVSISEVNMQNEVKTGPYIVSSDEYINAGQIMENAHSMTIIQSDQTLEGTIVEGRNGPYPQIYSKNIVSEFRDSATMNIYQKIVNDVIVSETEIKKLSTPKP